MLIIRRSKLCYTAYGIITLCRWPSGAPDRNCPRNPLHVLSNFVLIIRTPYCIKTASGIVFSVSDRPVCRLRRNLHTGLSLTQNTIPDAVLTLRLLMSYIYIYIYMEFLVKPEMLTSYIYGPTFGNTESCLFLFAAQCFNTVSMQSDFW